ncbi:hypothetical protein EDM00_08930 [Ornithobacterium rhinotracheale]|nr:hypothetical protein [Ornithobacterium rhinotracheale]MRJ09250.1 hypothetical protein [Ornithobacterium rhinotracheale]MRJ11477.1 hypothetical protein [Ornithobacterium rhinotracheale]
MHLGYVFTKIKDFGNVAIQKTKKLQKIFITFSEKIILSLKIIFKLVATNNLKVNHLAHDSVELEFAFLIKFLLTYFLLLFKFFV